MGSLLNGGTDVLTNDGRSRGSLSVELLELSQVDLVALDKLGLADAGVLKGVDGGSLLLDGLANDIRAELLEEELKIAASSLTVDDFDHLAAELLDLRRLGIRSLLDLAVAAASEGHGEETDGGTIGGLDFSGSLDESLPLADKGLGVISSESQSIEVGQHTVTIDVVSDEADDAVALLLAVLVQISQ